MGDDTALPPHCVVLGDVPIATALAKLLRAYCSGVRVHRTSAGDGHIRNMSDDTCVALDIFLPHTSVWAVGGAAVDSSVAVDAGPPAVVDCHWLYETLYRLAAWPFQPQQVLLVTPTGPQSRTGDACVALTAMIPSVLAGGDAETGGRSGPAMLSTRAPRPLYDHDVSDDVVPRRDLCYDTVFACNALELGALLYMVLGSNADEDDGRCVTLLKQPGDSAVVVCVWENSATAAAMHDDAILAAAPHRLDTTSWLSNAWLPVTTMEPVRSECDSGSGYHSTRATVAARLLQPCIDALHCCQARDMATVSYGWHTPVRIDIPLLVLPGGYIRVYIPPISTNAVLAALHEQQQQQQQQQQ